MNIIGRSRLVVVALGARRLPRRNGVHAVAPAAADRGQGHESGHAAQDQGHEEGPGGHAPGRVADAG